MVEEYSRFLTIPLEIRKLIYDLLFQPTRRIAIQAAPQREYEYSPVTETGSTTWPVDFESWAITPHPQTSQFLRVCSQVHAEATPFLYSSRLFDLTYRDSFKLLLHNIGPSRFADIRHISLDWDALEELARALNKDNYQSGLAGLRSVETASWRVRHLGGTSMRWRNVKASERGICQATQDITEKHAFLKVVAEQPYQRRSSVVPGEASRTTPSNCKVKWRILADGRDMTEDEAVVDIKRDLERLRATKDEASDSTFSLLRIDPF